MKIKALFLSLIVFGMFCAQAQTVNLCSSPTSFTVNLSGQIGTNTIILPIGAHIGSLIGANLSSVVIASDEASAQFELASSPSSITVGVWADCRFSGSSMTYSISNGTNTTSGTWNVAPYNNSTINLQSNDQIVFSSLNKTFTRKYTFQNGSPTNLYSGKLRFTDQYCSSISLSSITASYNGSTHSISLGIPFDISGLLGGSTLVIEETFTVISALPTTDCYSSVQAEFGCGYQNSFTACNTIPFTPIVRDDGTKQKISYISQKNNYEYFTCFGVEQDHFVRFKNEGNASTGPLSIFWRNTESFNELDEKDGQQVDPTSFIVRIYNPDGTLKLSAPVYRHPANQAPPGLAENYYHTYCNSASKEYFKDYIAPTSLTYGDYDAKFVQCSSNEVLRHLVISHLDISPSLKETISLEPGEVIEIFWEYKNCCFNGFIGGPKNYGAVNILITQRNVDNVIVDLQDISPGGNRYNISSAFRYNVDLSIKPFNSILIGDPDLCPASVDGEVRTIKAKINQFDLNASRVGFDLNKLGDFVVEFDLSMGLDLDRSLGGVATPLSYSTAPTCNKTNCGSCSMPAWSGQQYNVILTHPIYGTFPGTVSTLSTPNDFATVSGHHYYKVAFDLKAVVQNLLYLQSLGMTYPTYYSYDELLSIVMQSFEFQFDVRGLCGEASSSGLLHFKYQPVCAGSCAVPLSSVDFKATVICPGCITPGANILSAGMFRSIDYLGNPDQLNLAGNPIEDGLPDNSSKITDQDLMRNATNSDVLEFQTSFLLSDGENSNPAGYQLDKMHAKGITLDNMYLELVVGAPNTGSTSSPPPAGFEEFLFIEPNTASVSLDNITWFPIQNPVKADTKRFVFQITTGASGDITSFPNFDAFAGSRIYFKANFKVNPYLQATGYESQLIYVDVNGFMSDCDNCINSILEDSEAKSLSVVNCMKDPGLCFGVDITNNFYLCTAGQTMFNFIPGYTDVFSYMGDDVLTYPSGVYVPDACQKFTSMRTELKMIKRINTPIQNAFPGEYRVFLDGKVQTFGAQIPQGYRISSAEIVSYYTVYPAGSVDTYKIPNPQSYVNSNQFSFQINYKAIPDDNGFVSYFTGDYDPAVGVRLGDEEASVTLHLFLEPIDCAAILKSSYTYNNEPLSFPSTDVEQLPLPVLTTPDLPGLKGGTNLPLRNYYGTLLTKNKTELISNPSTQIYPQSGYHLVPFSIQNRAPRDANGNILKAPNTVEYSSEFAKNPYLYISNIATLQSEGFDVVGVYSGTLNAAPSNPAVNNYYNSNGFAHLKSMVDGQYIGFIAPNSVSEYTLVMKYNCPSGCSPLLPECNSSDALLPACIKNPSIAKLEYGWSCVNYPISNADLNKACQRTSISDITMNKESVSLDLATSLNGLPVNGCEEFTYEIILNSCKAGGISSLKPTVTLPAGLQYIGHSALFGSTPITVASTSIGQTITFDDLVTFDNDVSYSGFDLKAFKIMLNLRYSTFNASGSITTTINGKTYCSSDITKTKTDLITTSAVPAYIPLISEGVTTCSSMPLTATIHSVGLGEKDLKFEWSLPSNLSMAVVTANVTWTAADLATTSTQSVFGIFNSTTNKYEFLVSNTLLGVNQTFDSNEKLEITVNSNPLCPYNIGQVNLAVSSITACDQSINGSALYQTTHSFSSCTPVASINGLNNQYCQSNVPVNFTVTPTGGLVSGTNVDPVNMTFTPSTLGVNTINYSYILDGCSLSVQKGIMVNPKPIVDFTTPAEYCFGTIFNLNGSPSGGVFSGIGVTLVSGQYQFMSSSATAHSITYTYTDPITGCAGTITKEIIPSPCCPYRLMPINVMCGTNDIHCVQLQAVRPVGDGIKGMDFVLRYDASQLEPIINSANGNNIAATFGNVILNGGVTASMVDIASNITIPAGGGNMRDMHVTIFYNSNAPANSDWSGTGEVVCLQFRINGTSVGALSNIRIGVLQNSSIPVFGFTDEEYTISTQTQCVEDNGTGLVNVIQNPILNGIIRYHNTSTTLNYNTSNPSQFNVTNISTADALCNSVMPAVSTVPNTSGQFTINMTGSTRLRFDRDIAGDYYSPNCSGPSADVLSVMTAMNGYDSYLVESIVTMRNPSGMNLTADRGVPNQAGVPSYDNSDRRRIFPTPFQMIAADVNLNGMVRANDITWLQQRAISHICEFPQAWNYVETSSPAVPISPGLRSFDWRFTNKTGARFTNYPNPGPGTPPADRFSGYWRDATPISENCVTFTPAAPDQCRAYPTQQTVFAILLGDLDGSWRTAVNAQDNMRVASGKQVVLDYANMTRTGAQSFRIPVSFDSEDTIVSLDFALNYDESKIRIAGVGNLKEGTDKVVRMVHNDFNNSELLLTSYTMSSLRSGTHVYYIDITTLDGNMDASYLGSGAGFLNGEKVNLVIEGVVTSVNTEHKAVQLFEVVPNPNNGNGQINYSVLSEVDGRIVVYNAVGQVVGSFENLSGTGTIELSELQLANGMYQAVLYHGISQEVRKIVVTK